ncbi:hypothetical protein [Rhizobium sp. Root1220]|uniref:hypothetical protein n=1 Tax=Rhizobium sp. Root1220 TaxID=1736432 RepID=UPI0006FDAA50|nr:hypothetical protein [Rhizobium sp. Root1220]KQV66184.1 hypothetical protein ASC90_13390 [Rhizobium sp. Root1220]
MSSRLDIDKIDNGSLREVWSVREFVRRHRLDKDEEKRLLTLFGSFATKQELLSNAQRPCLFR